MKKRINYSVQLRAFAGVFRTYAYFHSQTWTLVNEVRLHQMSLLSRGNLYFHRRSDVNGDLRLESEPDVLRPMDPTVVKMIRTL